MLTIRLPADVETRLAHFIGLSGQNVETLICQAISDYLDDQEDLAVAEQRLKHPGKRLTMNDVVKQLDLEH